MGAGKKVIMDIETDLAGNLLDFKSVSVDGKIHNDQIDAYRYMMSAATRPAVIADLADLERRMVRQVGKKSALAAAYGMGGQKLADLAQAFMKPGPSRPELDAADNTDNDEDWRWAVAFRVVMGVGPEFYERASMGRKRWLEQHHSDLATHDTPKGRKAAKVVAHRVKMTLEGRGRAQLNDRAFFAGDSWAGSMTGRGPSLQNIPKKPFEFNHIEGRTFDRIILDEAATLKGVIDDPKGTSLEDQRREAAGLSLDGHDASDACGQHGDPQE